MELLQSSRRKRHLAEQAQPSCLRSGQSKPLPTGTLTFLFTDIEGSTRRWEEHPVEMRDALARHNAILRSAIEVAGGAVYEITGDGLLAVFSSARGAVSAAVQAQIQLAGEPWQPAINPIRVRMGIHTDEASIRDGRYLNQPLNRCARLMASAHGGQVVLSGSTEALVRDSLPDGCELDDLGHHRLRDLSQAVRVYQLNPPGLPHLFPPLKSLEPALGSLPTLLSSFIGRDADIAFVGQTLRKTRLVTITGAGGVGKTRLALQVAQKLQPSFPDGVWFCELAAATDRDSMLQVVLSSLRVRGQTSTIEGIINSVRSRQILLILDNCEHLLSEATLLAETVLRECPGARIMATSREAMSVDGEHVWVLRPLSLPEGTSAVGQLDPSGEAVRLFVDRASAVRPGFALDDTNRNCLIEICKRLDGIPLAIELAAARTASMQPAEIAGLLEERFRLLEARHGAAGRHHTLRAAVEWSYSMLSDVERSVFNRLGVFPGSFDSDAAVGVAGSGDIGRWGTIDSLASLVAKSMVVADDTPSATETTRYRLLETMRAYARDRLIENNDLEATLRRHAAHFAEFAERAGPEFVQKNELHWRSRVQLEIHNLRSAAMWATSGRTVEDVWLGARVIIALGFESISTQSNVGAWADRALANVSATIPEIQPTVMAIAAWSRYWRGDLASARDLAEEVIASVRPEERFAIYLAKALLGLVHATMSDLTGALEDIRYGMQVAVEAPSDILFEAYFLVLETVSLAMNDQFVEARIPSDKAIAIARQISNPSLLSLALYARALALSLMDPEAALSAAEESLALAKAGTIYINYGFALSLAAAVRMRHGDLRRSIIDLKDAIQSQLGTGNRLPLGVAVARTALLFGQIGRPDTAVALARLVAERFPASPINMLAVEREELRQLRTSGNGSTSSQCSEFSRWAAASDDDVLGQLVANALGTELSSNEAERSAS
jgi:predicted ATPase/class 3 adenylate cyclase